MMRKHPKSLLVFFLACIIILITADAKGKWRKQETEATIGWDVSGYYFYLPAFFIYKDLSRLQFKDDILKKYKPTPSFYQAYEIGDGKYIMKYSVGLAILMTPFFLIGHCFAWISGVPMDGFSPPYQYAIAFGSLFVAFLGLWVSRKVLLKYFSDEVTALSILILLIGTNYLNYAAIDSAMTHNYLFTLYSLLIYISIRWKESPSYRNSSMIGLLIGLIALVRPTDIVVAILPLLWGISSVQQAIDRFQLWQTHWKKLVLSVVITGAIGSIQLLYWKVYGGQWLIYSYEDQGFHWDGVHLMDGFFSYRKGWLVYTPLMTFVILGFIPLFRKTKAVFLACFSFFLVYTYIVFSWEIWWYGGSFGQRAMVQSYAVLIFPLAAFLQWLFGQKQWLQIGLYLILGGLCWLNLHQTYQIHAHKGGMHPENMTKAYYWRIFGGSNIPESDRILLDTDEDFRGQRFEVKRLYEESFEEYPLSDYIRDGKKVSGQKSAFVNFDYPEFAPLSFPVKDKNFSWIRVQGHFFAPWKEWEEWIMPKLRVRFKAGDQVVKERYIRISRLLPENQWTPIWIDCSLPEEDFDRIEIEIDLFEGKKELWIDDIVVESFCENPNCY